MRRSHRIRKVLGMAASSGRIHEENTPQSTRNEPHESSKQHNNQANDTDRKSKKRRGDHEPDNGLHDPSTASNPASASSPAQSSSTISIIACWDCPILGENHPCIGQSVYRNLE